MARESGSDNMEGNKAMQGGMERLLHNLDAAPKGLPPIERWNPPFCGDIDMRIASNGSWFYLGTPIVRPALVKLFASVLKLEAGRFFLVTPVEKVGITVEDAPFQAVEMAVDGEKEARQITFRTNVDDLVSTNAEHRLSFTRGSDGALKPYLHVRNGLLARLTRALTYDLLALGDVAEHEGAAMFGLFAGGVFHPAIPASDIEGLA